MLIRIHVSRYNLEFPFLSAAVQSQFLLKCKDCALRPYRVPPPPPHLGPS